MFLLPQPQQRREHTRQGPLASQHGPEGYLFFCGLQKQEVTFQVIADLLWAHGWSLCIVPAFLFELGGSGQRDRGKGNLPMMLLQLQATLLRGRVTKTYSNPCQRLARNIWHLTYNKKWELKVKSHTTQVFRKRICLCHQLLLGCKGTVYDSGMGSGYQENTRWLSATVSMKRANWFYLFLFSSPNAHFNSAKRGESRVNTTGYLLCLCASRHQLFPKYSNFPRSITSFGELPWKNQTVSIAHWSHVIYGAKESSLAMCFLR